jgi:sigma-B regulation protein RsbU (phosphoserine phosphatase)
MVLATLFAAATTLYSVLWMYNVRRRPRVELGFDNQYVASEHCELVRSVVRNSPAEEAGLRAGDRILGINGRPLESVYSLEDVWARHQPGDSVELTIKRANASAPLLTKGVFRARRDTSKEGGITQHLGADITNTYPVAFLVIGLAVLFLRLEDPNAWLLALMFGGFIAIPDVQTGFVSSLRGFAIAYRAIFDSVVAPLFYFFFSVFPTRSPLDRRLPWLKWASLALGTSFALPLMGVGRPAIGYTRILILSLLYGFIALGFVSLIWNAISATTPEARRKIRVILWGTLVGVVPATLLLAASDFLGFHPPFLLGAAIVLLLWLFPLSFAYAVVKHRVLEIPVLLRRSARYLLVQRGFTIILALLSIGVTLAFALLLARYLQPVTKAAVPGGIALGAAFGTLLLWTGALVHKGVGGRIDRAFFRNAYDARMILQDLAEKTRTATDRQELAALLEHHLTQALQPSSLVVYLETHDSQLSAASGNVPSELETISATEPMIADLAHRGRPWEVSPERTWSAHVDALERHLDHMSNSPSLLALLRPDCLVPMLGRDGRLVGLLALGLRLSEEPYSTEDKHLLASVASQAGVTLENIRLGEKIAERIEAERRSGEERMEAERRVAREMEIAKQVQARLFPQKLPVLHSLEYVGQCIQARQVGGDYYDFLDLGPGRMGIVMADIAGKGISGALLMANLQANLRSQYAVALEDLPRLLQSVNRLFHENTSEESYATLFFADYDDASRRLRYANCGHNPPILMRAGGQVERLAATTTVVGLFTDWECTIGDAALESGDLLVIYTDGVTEAANADGEEFGEDRLLEAIWAYRSMPPGALLRAISAEVQRFSYGEQADDLTLVVVKSR